jgi:pimeloyl-ACP methyl ester carboxylesterase
LDVLFTPESFAPCVESLSATADLTKYTTPIAMDDLNEIRMALGYDHINLIGGSYGTRASLVYMRRHAATVRSAILTGVAPIAFTNPLYHAAGGQRALDMVLDACALDPECAAAFPGLRRKLDTVLQRLDEKPAHATVTHPVTGEPVQVDLSREAFAGALRVMMYYGSREIPSLLNRAFEGDLDPFAQHAMQRSRAIRNALAFGMLLCVTCNEDIPRINPDDIDRLTAGTFLGDGRVRRQMAICEIWPRGGVPDNYGEPVRVNVPTLFVSGEYDPVTPPSWGDHVARNLPDSRHVVVPGAAHGPGGPCVEAIMRTFLDARRVEDRDLACLKLLRLPRFQLDEP